MALRTGRNLSWPRAQPRSRLFSPSSRRRLAARSPPRLPEPPSLLAQYMSAALYDHKPEAYNEKGPMEKEQSARENPEDGHLRPVIADAFALREGEEGEDFKTLGWFKAGLVITCEVRCPFKAEGRRP